MTNATGVTQQESTYYPFGGEQRVITNTVDNRYKFTGLERDAESSLDYTLFRMYPSNLARWLSPDPIAGNVENPGSLNRYTYVLNNPVNLTDPLGLQGCPPHNPDCLSGFRRHDPCSDPRYAITHAECGPIRTAYNPWVDLFDIHQALRQVREQSRLGRLLSICRKKCPPGTKADFDTALFVSCVGEKTFWGMLPAGCAAAVSLCFRTGNMVACALAAIVCTVTVVGICACRREATKCVPEGAQPQSQLTPARTFRVGARSSHEGLGP